VTDGLIAKYSFNNGNADDEQGSVNGTIHNTVLTTDRFGCLDHAYSFSSADTSFITLGDNFDEVIAQADSSFSFSFWFKLNGDTNSYRPVLLAKYGNSGCGEDQREFFLLMDTNKVQFYYFTTLYFGDVRGINGTTIINDTNWHHLVVNYNGNIDDNDGLDRVEFYLDNNPDSTYLAYINGGLGDIQNSSAHFSIGPALSSNGNVCVGSNNFFSGKMDDILIFNRALSVAEIDLLYNDENPCLTKINTADLSNPIVRIYPNPASSYCNFESEIPIMSIHIINVTGSVVRSYSGGNILKISMKELPKGMYYMKGHLSNNEQFVKKLLIGN
jgi:hypothetical protein